MPTALVSSAASLTLPLVALQSPEVIAEWGAYRARLAITELDRLAAYRLRFLVFNLELREGLESAFDNGYDTDHFDSVCDHLLVEHTPTATVVGTYRLQSGDRAARHHGYYSEQEFDFAPYEALRSQVMELGRACLHRQHRSAEVLNLLWKGVVRYTVSRGGRYLIGCCSLTSQDPCDGAAVFASVRPYMAQPHLISAPHPAFALPPCTAVPASMQPPKLLRAYLAMGACICAEPAIDRAFGTIDFLTMIDLQSLHPRVMRRLA